MWSTNGRRAGSLDHQIDRTIVEAEGRVEPARLRPALTSPP
jgi:hypothetical protein